MQVSTKLMMTLYFDGDACFVAVSRAGVELVGHAIANARRYEEMKGTTTSWLAMLNLIVKEM